MCELLQFRIRCMSTALENELTETKAQHTFWSLKLDQTKAQLDLRVINDKNFVLEDWY